MKINNPSNLKLFQPIETQHLSFAINLLLGCLRSGGRTVQDLLVYLRNENHQRKRYPNETVQKLLFFVETHSEEEVQEAITYYREWELLSFEQKQKIKSNRGQFFQQKNMADKPPTEKQITLLQKLGHHEIPSNRLEASKLIEQKIHGSTNVTSHINPN